MKTADFDYELPEELIAQTPCPVRDACKLLVVDRAHNTLEDRIFRDIIEYLNPGDLLVANETRVLPARLLGKKRGTGGAAEILLLRKVARDAQGARSNSVSQGTYASCNVPRASKNSSHEAFWEALVRPGKRLKPGSGAIVDFTDAQDNCLLSAEVVDWSSSSEGTQKGERLVRLFCENGTVDDALHAIGHTPLPPYIHDYTGDTEMYQTTYAKREASAAAPTAGLHFTPELIERIREKNVGWATVELEVGLDTFRIVDEENAEDHVIHTEQYTVPSETVRAIEACKSAGGRVIAVGTTSVRSLESAAARADESAPGQLIVPVDCEKTSLYIMPGYEFKVVDAMITNFHVPRSTLMMLVSAFAGRDTIMDAYAHAIEKRYRMLSFGDAMLIM